MGVMNESIEDGIGDGGIADVLMPVFDRKLTAENGGAGAVAVFDHLREVTSFRVR